MDPKHLSSFLKKYEKLPLPKRRIKELVGEALGAPALIKDISLVRGVLHVKTTSTALQELYLKKKKILALLQKEGVIVNDIR